MRLDLYQQQTTQLAHIQAAILEEAVTKLEAGKVLSLLEQNGVLHALQLLIENAIGKAKHLLKNQGFPVPVSAYDAFKLLITNEILPLAQLDQWNAVIGIRNRIVHDYMNININLIFELLKTRHYRFIVEFLLQPFSQVKEN